MKNAVKCLAMLCMAMLFNSPAYAQVHHPLFEALALRPYFVQPTPGKAVFLAEGKSVIQDTIEAGETPTVATILRQDVRKILAPYCGGYDNVNQETINEAFADNPFLVIEFTSNFGLKTDRMGGGTGREMAPQATNPVSSIADGIARFLVKRTKEELSLAFFADFKRAVAEDHNGFFRYFFPSTQQLLLVIDTEVYQFQIYLEALREAFVTDMRFLPGNLSNYLRDTDGAGLKPAQLAVSIDFFQVVQMTINGDPTVNMLRFLASDTLSQIQGRVDTIPGLQNLAAGLQFTNQLSESLFNPETGKWYSGNDIRKALADPITFRLYLGLLWHHARPIKPTFKNGQSIATIIGKAAVVPTLISDWHQLITGFGDNTDAMEESSRMRGNKESSLSDNFSKCLQVFTQMLQTANTLNKLFNPEEGDAIEAKYLQLIQQIGYLQFNTKQKHYSAAVGNGVFILDILLGKDFTGKKEMLKYGMFISAVAEAENPGEVQNALELFALPPGSSKVKKADKTFTIAINAYTGANVSSENLRTRLHPEIAKQSTSLAVAAPLGFSLNWGRNWGSERKPKSGCIGFFFPVIDVGAIYAYRFQEDVVDNLPPLEWKNIVAPGVYLVIDPPLGKWPLSFGIGGQLGPLLRKVEENGVFRNRDVGGYRIGAFATFDIPINYLKVKIKN